LASRFLSADPRTLIIRVLVAAGRAAGGLTSDEIVEFLEASFGVFQTQRAGTGGWDRGGLERALNDLARHRLIERAEGGRFVLTALGRLAGEGAVEVETLLRVVDCLRALRADEVTDPALVAIAQMSVELDAVYFPVNKRSTQKEPRHWANELQGQGISPSLVAYLGRNITEAAQETVRAKKAAACLYYVAGTSMEHIERAMAQFGGAFDGVAGPIRNVASRTCDVVAVIAQAAEIVHAGTDVQQRVPRLQLRLELGIRGPAVDLARHTERHLDRADYQRLCDANLTTQDALDAASDDSLLQLLSRDASKVRVVRDALDRWRTSRPAPEPAPRLPGYEA